MNLSPRFDERCKSLYSSLSGRAKQKKSATGRITRNGYQLPFDRKQLSAWLVDMFGGNESGVIRCRYCKTPIDAYSCVIDHAHPLKRGGSPGLENLEPVCGSCNSVKGLMLPDEFHWFLDRMAEMSVRFPGSKCVQDITSRLQKAVKLAAAMRYNIASKHKAEANAVTAQESDDNW